MYIVLGIAAGVILLAVVTGLVLGAATLIEVKRVLKGGRK